MKDRPSYRALEAAILGYIKATRVDCVTDERLCEELQKKDFSGIVVLYFRSLMSRKDRKSSVKSGCRDRGLIPHEVMETLAFKYIETHNLEDKTDEDILYHITDIKFTREIALYIRMVSIWTQDLGIEDDI